MIEEAIAREYPRGEMRCPVHLSIGQEAAAVGIASTLTPLDLMVSTHRSHAHYLAKGGDLVRMLGELYGKQIGCSKGQGGSMHLVDWSVGFAGSTSIVAGTVPVGVGLAFAQKLRSEPHLTVVMLGDAATEEGVVHESMNFARLHKLPVLFVIEHNNFSCYTHIKERRPTPDLRRIGYMHDIPSYIVPMGMAVEDVLYYAHIATHEIRRGEGPQLIVVNNYRLIEHCGPNNDDELKYRSEDEVRYWQTQDQLHLLDDKKARAEITSEIERAFQIVKDAPYPERVELGRYVYAPDQYN